MKLRKDKFVYERPVKNFVSISINGRILLQQLNKDHWRSIKFHTRKKYFGIPLYYYITPKQIRFYPVPNQDINLTIK